MPRKKSVSRKDIVTLYMNYVLEHNRDPNTVYAFTKMNNFEEAKFYEHFTSFKAIEKEVFETFFTNSITVLNKSEDYNMFSARNKVLSFYYIFFENLTANRSYVTYALEKHKMNFKGLKTLAGLKLLYTNYIDELGINLLNPKEDRLEKLQISALKESSWLQLLLTLKFWLDDTSPSFEKTDIFIEKSINTAFDVLEVAPLKRVLDLGKFLYKEKFQMN